MPEANPPATLVRQRRHPERHPKGCDTFVAYPPTTAQGLAVFGKNSDRPAGEKQPLRKYPAKRHPPGATLECTYLSIPQAEETYAILLSQIDWMWGGEHGANEHGVAIGNEAVWTRVPDEVDEASGTPKKLLLGMDLVRLGLERSRTSREALETITSLLEAHGQGGPCAEGDPDFTYHNSFLAADAREAWVLETAGRHWAARRVTEGARNISNGLTLRTDFDRASEGLEDYARELGLWDGSAPLDFAAAFAEGGAALVESDARCGRQAGGRALLDRHENSGGFDHRSMIDILCDEESGICMKGGLFETTASMVSELVGVGPGDGEPSRTNRHWTSGPHPTPSSFSRQAF